MSETELIRLPYTSETSKHRELIEPFCVGYGIDIGFGGDPITPGAIRVDLPEPYAYTGEFPVQLGGDCRDLRWFRDDQLDYVYSSHVLEDFDERETEIVLREWIRVLRVGGNLVLLLPDQQRYVRHCLATGQYINEHHSIDHFSLEYVKQVAKRIGGLERIEAQTEVGFYSFLAVFRKTLPTMTDAQELAQMRARMNAAWQERDALKEETRALKRQLEDTRLNYQCAEDQLQKIRRQPLFRVCRKVYRGLTGRWSS